ncbi:hypothetical protein [Paenibacillus campi]|uniref:hypothetical protein n=1 Tax=Paenibacillus campi TaxID=3106031 RepID=UPI002B000E52|nr:hypothetical protein [Paenibacillus sp. SGZ-1009]
MYGQDWGQWFDTIYPLLRAIAAMIGAAVVLLIVIVNLPHSRLQQLFVKLGWMLVVTVFIVSLLHT